jgi:hypothetical protein
LARKTSHQAVTAGFESILSTMKQRPLSPDVR